MNNQCDICGWPDGTHSQACTSEAAMLPKIFRISIPEDEEHPSGRKAKCGYGVYFPLTDLCVNDMGQRRTGRPHKADWVN